ncbi:MAG: PDZ domain-containing protein, partial [Nitrospirota bacterium]|nr:PDZ domain-containing protein [Nitrospirota bacterium]
MRSKAGIKIESIMPGSLADEAGLRPGDLLLSINSHPLHDVIDFMFYNSADSLDIKYKRKGSIKKIQLITENENDLGLTIQSFKVKTCKNNCL